MSNLKNNDQQLFNSILKGIYQRDRYPHIVNIKPLSKSFKYVDLLASSICYSLVTPYNNRVDYYWPLLSRCICNGDKSNIVYISLVFNKPTTLNDLRVTYINSINDLNLYPSLKERVLSNLIQIIRD